LNFFNIDLHISVIEDISTIFRDLGHEVTSWNMSGHNWVFGRQPKIIPELMNWRNFDQKICDQFYEKYKKELSGYDGFIACYPPSFSLLFEKFQKPIYVVAATRYDYPISRSSEGFAWLNDKLGSMITSGQVIPIANNRFDAFYCEYYLGKKFTHIPSLCEYTKCKYTGRNGRFCVYEARRGTHTWSDLYDHLAIIHAPYNVSTMSIFEHYTANVPMLFPSKTDRRPMSQLFFDEHQTNFDLLNHAWELADFYDEEWMPHLLYYGIDTEIRDLKADFPEISESVRRFNVLRKQRIYELWSRLIY